MHFFQEPSRWYQTQRSKTRISFRLWNSSEFQTAGCLFIPKTFWLGGLTHILETLWIDVADSPADANIFGASHIADTKTQNPKTRRSFRLWSLNPRLPVVCLYPKPWAGWVSYAHFLRIWGLICHPTSSVLQNAGCFHPSTMGGRLHQFEEQGWGSGDEHSTICGAMWGSWTFREAGALWAGHSVQWQHYWSSLHDPVS